MPARTRRRLTLICAVAAALLALPSYLRAYTLSGSSDAPTLLLGDTAIVNHAAFWIHVPYTSIRLWRVSRPSRGDMVLIRHPQQPGVRIFKRVIALPGETVAIADNRVLIDGQPLPLRPLPAPASAAKPLGLDFARIPAARHRMGNTIYNEDGHWIAFTPGAGNARNLAPVHLGAGQYFLLGDNRDPSLDCRVWGPLPEDSILGKVILTFPTGPRR